MEENRTPIEVFYSQVGELIARYRSELNLTQTDLAVKIGATQQVIASYEIGRRRVPLQTFVKLAEILQVNIEDLLPISQNKKPGPKSLIERRLEYIKSLPDKKQKKILEMINNAIEIAS